MTLQQYLSTLSVFICPSFFNIVFPPLLLYMFLSFPFTAPCRMDFAKSEDLEIWPNLHSFRFRVRHFSNDCLDPSSNLLISYMYMLSNLASFSLTLMPSSLHRHTDNGAFEEPVSELAVNLIVTHSNGCPLPPGSDACIVLTKEAPRDMCVIMLH